MDKPIRDPDWELYVDGCDSVNSQGERYAGYAVVTLTLTVEAWPLLQGTSAQLAELRAPTWALELSEEKIANIFTESHFAFLILQVHGAIYREREYLVARGKDLKHPREILQLLEVVWKPRQVAVAHCKGHQKGRTVEAKGNTRADINSEYPALHCKEGFYSTLPQGYHNPSNPVSCRSHTQIF